MSVAHPKPVDLHDLALLNQEIAALVRAGVPLESGLAMAAQSGTSSQDIFLQRLSERMREGHSFPDALQMEGTDLPRSYRAIVEAGARAGRLPEALESLASFAQETLRLRRRVDQALLYPAMVVMLTGLSMAWLVWFFVPRLSHAYESLKLPLATMARAMIWLQSHYWSWVWIVPATVIGLSVWWWLSTRGRHGVQGTIDTGPWSAFQIFPGVRSIMSNFRRANFCDLFAMLLSHQVPLPNAVLLAADASGDSTLGRVAARIADGVRAGNSFADCVAVDRELPPFVSWMLISGDRRGVLVKTLKQVAEVSRQRAASQSDWLRVVLPMLLMIVIGGSAVMTYALAVFGPLSELLRALAMYEP